MKINVSWKHITHGDRNKCTTCPVALAIREALRCPPYDVLVTSGEVDLYAKEKWDTVRLPSEATEFINNFDKTGTGEPFEFDLPLENIV